MPVELAPPRRSAHSVVELPIAERPGVALPLLFLQDGQVSVFAAAYVRNLDFTGIKPETLLKRVKAIGLLYDYYQLEKGGVPLDERELQLLVKQFYEARRYGCPNLGWKPVGMQTAKNDLGYVSDFSLFCASNFGHMAINPSEEVLVTQLAGKGFYEWLATLNARKKFDMLLHVQSATKLGQGVVTRPLFRPESGKNGRSQTAKRFPPEHVLSFISSAPSIRDKLCWLLLFFGGIRTSELMHLYLRDITQEKDGTARVVLAHPRDGAISWADARGKKQNGTRQAFLKDRYGRIPRDMLPVRHPEHAGWKGMLYEDSQRRESQVYWSDPRMGQLFWQLHVQYLRTERLRVPDDHPYYLVSLRGETYGMPLRRDNLRKQFYDNAARIGLSASTDGVNPHGGRHFYGYYGASWLRLAKEQLQKLMHHRSATATDVYYALDQAVVRAELVKAQEKLHQSIPAFMANDRLLLPHQDTHAE